jgi:four helix bundle protein
MTISNYRGLHVWQAGMKLAEEAYKASKKFPRSETYGLSAQLQRSAVSVPSNIAEGQGRRSKGDFARFLGIALGSIAEVETQVILAQRLGYLDATVAEGLLGQADRIGRMLLSLRRKMQPP